MHAHEPNPVRFTVTPSARPGRTVDLGRRRRLPSAAILRALWDRDQGCRYPGCDRRRFLHAHHLRHRADGGPTCLDNLALLYGQHHRLLHEGRYQLRVDGSTTTASDASDRVVAVADLLCGPAAPPPTPSNPRWSS